MNMQGYLCQSGEDCTHGFDSTHWVDEILIHTMRYNPEIHYCPEPAEIGSEVKLARRGRVEIEGVGLRWLVRPSGPRDVEET